jgi:TPR repeat protein
LDRRRAYRDGREVTADVNQAVRWFLRASEAGPAKAAGSTGKYHLGW